MQHCCIFLGERWVNVHVTLPGKVPSCNGKPTVQLVKRIGVQLWVKIQGQNPLADRRRVKCVITPTRSAPSALQTLLQHFKFFSGIISVCQEPGAASFKNPCKPTHHCRCVLAEHPPCNRRQANTMTQLWPIVLHPMCNTPLFHLAATTHSDTSMMGAFHIISV